MGGDVALTGRPAGMRTELGAALGLTGLTVREPVDLGAGQAAIMVAFFPGADDAIAAAQDFAAGSSEGSSRLIVLARQQARRGDWPACRDAAIIRSFIRHFALAAAGSNIRVNGLELAFGVTDGDLARAVSAMWRWRSMTGQIVCLDSGDGAARDAQTVGERHT